MPPKKLVKRTETLLFKHQFTRINEGKKIEDRYEFDPKQLGEGSYGQVFKGKDMDTGAFRAIKKIDINRISNPSRFEEEISIQKSLDHPNIVKVHEVFKDAKMVYLVMELCNGGELFDRIVKEAEESGVEGVAFTEAGAATYMSQIIGAIQYIHSKDFVHRDIKPENFLLQNEARNAQIKVIDFGLAKYFRRDQKEPMLTKAGTPYYVAPEVLGPNGYNEKCDIWSCGVICYILICGYPPFYGDDDPQILKCVKAGAYDFPSPDWDEVSKHCKDMIQRMLRKDPADRPSAEELMSHPWLSSKAAKREGHVSRDLGSRLRKFRGATKLKKVALTCIAQQLDDRDIDELAKTFRLLDNNQDGTLTPQEIRDGMAKHKVKIPDDMEDMLRQLDSDGSGAIDYTEFIAATLTTKQYLKKDAMWAAFRTFDHDNDGTITREELSVLLKDPTMQVIDNMINEVDLDGDGKIQFEEFCRMLETSSVIDREAS